MANFNVYDFVIVPIGEKLRGDSRFSGINVFYDRSEEKIVPHAFWPAINYFIMPTGAEDTMRGSRTGTFQDRRFRLPVGFGIWMFGAQPDALDRALWGTSEDLRDWLSENVDFDRTNGVAILGPKIVRIDYAGDENGMAGDQLVTCEFEMFSGSGV